MIHPTLISPTLLSGTNPQLKYHIFFLHKRPLGLEPQNLQKQTVLQTKKKKLNETITKTYQFVRNKIMNNYHINLPKKLLNQEKEPPTYSALIFASARGTIYIWSTTHSRRFTY